MDDLMWRKSAYSGSVRQNCLEVAETAELIHLRDTQHRERGYLSFPVVEWSVFLAEVRRDGV